MKAIMLIVVALLLSGCSAQVAGMQSPVLHDYGSIDWIPVTQEIEQRFIAGSGNSAAVQNDPGTTPGEYQARLSQLPEDARGGTLRRLRLGLRLSGRNDAAWNTGARLQLAYDDGQPFLDVSVDTLPRSGERVEIDSLPRIEPGGVVVIRLLPGEGPDAARLRMGFTPWRAPHGGWRASTNTEEMRGAMVFDTRYERDVAALEIAEAALSRVSQSGSAFLGLFGLMVGSLIGAIVVLWRMPSRVGVDGR